MKSALTLLLSASACSAFVPASVTRTNTKINSVFDDYVGAQDFRGKEMKFDPVSSFGTTYRDNNNMCIMFLCVGDGDT